MLGGKVMNGLSSKEVEESKKKYGTNQFTKQKRNTFLELFLESLGDPIIKILLIALGIKILFLLKDFDWYETIGIVLSILVASFISTVSEYGSEKAFSKMQEEAEKMNTKVIRNGKKTEIPLEEVVKNDLVYIETGDFVPADGILIEGSLSIDESMISGESKEKQKKKQDKVFRGTTVFNGQGYIKVTQIGDETMMGKMSLELSEKAPISPLRLRLQKLALFISKIGYGAAILVFFSYLFSVVVLSNQFDLTKIIATITNFPLLFGHILYALTLSVTIIIVAVPEGLPMMITLVLSSNMKRMLKDHVLVRKMVGIETAGNISLLFTDKTGTLTKGKLEVIEIVNGNQIAFHSPAELTKYPIYEELVKDSLLLNNDCMLEDGKFIGGNSTDQALRKFFGQTINNKKIIHKTPFHSENKFSKVTLENKTTYIKGAPEKILKNVTYFIDEHGRKKRFLNKEEILKEIQMRTKNSIRVLAFGIEEITGITFLGFISIKDDIRKEAIEGLSLTKSAGIQTVMITGDNKNTAVAIARELGLIESNQDLVLTSDELHHMTQEEIKKILPSLRVVARSLPQDKSMLVKIAKECGYVVGMTGDGVNDAPALKHADVGFAMGSGMEVSKEASDIVILDNNFLSISKAILYGRTIFKSIRKFIICQLTINLCAISLSILGPFVGIKTPITVIQMLWINMVMDTLMGLAFAFEPPLMEYMKEKPKKKGENIINGYMLHQILITGIYSAILCFLFIKLPIFSQLFQDQKHLLSAFFGLFIFIDIFNGFNARTHRVNIFANLWKNKIFLFIVFFIVTVQIFLIDFGGELFRTTKLSIFEFLIMIFCASSVLIIDFLRKLWLKKKGKPMGV